MQFSQILALASQQGGESASDPVLFPLSTGILFEGDSNTAWGYGTAPNWPKVTLAQTQGRYYLPVGGNFAVPGDQVADMWARRATVLAKVEEMVALTGGCVLTYQIGTNGGTAEVDIPNLTTMVEDIQAAGGTVINVLCPEFYVSSYRTALNAAVVDGTIPVDHYIVVADLITESPGKTHYSPAEHQAVGERLAALLNSLIVPADVTTDPAFTVDGMSGTGGTPGSGGSGQLPTGYSGARNSGDATAVYTALGDGLQGVITGGAAATMFTISAEQSLTFALGDVIDGGAEIELYDFTDDTTVLMAHVYIGGAFMPGSSGMDMKDAWWGGPLFWRAYPINQAAGGSSFSKWFRIQVAAGKSVSFRVRKFAHCIRQGSAAVAPVNTVAPVMGAAVVGGTPSCSDGTWTGSPAPTYAKQFYLGEASIASDYVFQSGDLAADVTCYVTATNSAGSAQAQSDIVQVEAAASVTTFDSSITASATMSYSNGDRTVTRVGGSGSRYAKSVAHKTTGKFYCEKEVDVAGIGGIGICGSTTGGTVGGTRVFVSPSGIATFTGGNNSTNNSQLLNTTGDRLNEALDMDAKLIWFRKNGAGNWNKDAAANPETGVGGWDCSGITDAYLLAHINTDLSQITLHLSAAEWEGAAPAGFGEWTA